MRKFFSWLCVVAVIFSIAVVGTASLASCSKKPSSESSSSGSSESSSSSSSSESTSDSSISSESSSGSSSSSSSDSGSQTESITVTFVDKDGNTVETITVVKGQNPTSTPSVPSVTGYKGIWENVDWANQTDDVTVEPVYTPKTYTVTFNMGNLGDVAMTAPQSITVTYDSEYTLPSYTLGLNEEYEFKGWRKSGSRKNVDISGVWTLDEDVSLTAVWEKVNTDSY